MPDPNSDARTAGSTSEPEPSTPVQLARLRELRAHYENKTPHRHLSWGTPSDREREYRAHWSRELVTELKTYVADTPDGLAELENQLLLGSKSVQSAALSAYLRSAAPDVAASKARQLLTSKKARDRLLGAQVFASQKTDEAIAVLEDRLDVETDEKVRDEILAALAPVWRAAGREFTMDEVEQRIQRAERLLAKPIATWLDEAKITPLVFSTGRSSTPQELRYLCARQARASDMEAEAEAQALLAVLDRERCASTAWELLQGFLKSGAAAKDKWAIALAGHLGDDRVTHALEACLHGWVSRSRGKLAEIAVGALSHLPGDRPLRVLDELSQKYRVKQRNIGAAANAAFEAAARSRGLTVEELGDDVVPWLGFAPGAPRVVDLGESTRVVSIGPDLEFVFTDPETRKTTKSLPKSADRELRAELKTAAADLRRALKTQAARHERMLVQQRRWGATRWRELYETHPVLRVFGTRSVWGVFDPQGELSASFRLLEDLTATSADDEEVQLADHDSIGLVHPMNLSHDQRTAWSRHFREYELAPLFPQIARPVEVLPRDRWSEKTIELTRGVKLNAPTFRGRVERLGWRRGSVVDAGLVSSYQKDHPAAGVTAILRLEQFWISADFTDEAVLDHALFVPLGSVETGSYVYDEPRDSEDPRVLRLGDVSAITYSETVSDLRTIVGGTTPTPK